MIMDDFKTFFEHKTYKYIYRETRIILREFFKRCCGGDFFSILKVFFLFYSTNSKTWELIYFKNHAEMLNTNKSQSFNSLINLTFFLRFIFVYIFFISRRLYAAKAKLSWAEREH